MPLPNFMTKRRKVCLNNLLEFFIDILNVVSDKLVNYLTMDSLIYSLKQPALMAMQISNNKQEVKGFQRHYLLFLVLKEITVSVQTMPTTILRPTIIPIQN